MPNRAASSKIQRNFLFIWIWFLFLLLSVLLLLLWIDHHPMLFLGNSESYTWSAISGWLPSNLAFVYGYFIPLVAVSSHSLVVLVMVQVALLVVASFSMAYLLIRYFRVRSWIAFIAAFLTSFEPSQLLYLFHSGYWIQFLLITPLGWGVLFYFSRDNDQRKKIGTIGLISLILLTTSVFLTEYPEPRYLHTTAWLFFLMAGIGLNSFIVGLHTKSAG
jgi:hypothetical protein